MMLATMTLLAGALLPASQGPGSQESGVSVAIVAETLHTAAGEPISNGVVWVEAGKIKAVGSADAIDLPPGIEVLRAKVAIPGLVDARSVVGLAGRLNSDHDQDQLERSGPIQPELRAIDAYNAREPLVAWIRSFGITTVHTGHGPGAVVSGQTLVAKTSGQTVDEAVIVPFAMVAATLGEGALGSDGKPPGTRAKAVALLRQQLVDAAAYAEERAADKPPARDLRKEALASVLAGERPLLVAAHRAHDIAAALRLASEFRIRLILDGAAEAYLMQEELAAAQVPVLIHAPMKRATGEAENLSMETPHLLQQAGIQVALQSGFEGYVPKTRVVLFEAAIAARYGCSFADALRLVTIDAATILGLESRVGSLEVGKDADIALYDGDPFEYTTHCTAVVIDGAVVHRR